ncbi:amine oxidase [Tamilnaduibacter salinus]|uniref:Amine oxidase n=1 Tax=Tamilnaduibacter salinus TaxID=1484056 RepID=A0A2A2I0V0_9GAMM|nr:FAD-dependent oxidoreductase [Tamilnaduibacter salinus]PAV24730.1 amine oxidase [Tamilnaduibacter salinus]
MNQTDIAIVGGGLAGVGLAEQLHRQGVDYQLFEARDRLGGRIESTAYDGARFDLGPAWFWHIQPRLTAACERFGIHVFEQFSDGELLFEDSGRQVHRGLGFASMAGSLRIDGGASALIDALSRDLPTTRLHLDAAVQSVSKQGSLQLKNGSTWQARRIILAIPPRIAAQLRFDPELTADQRQRLTRTPTWMAGQAKFIAIYEAPFWRQEGLSGDAMSQSGPLMEIHDASPAAGRPGALFGFFSVPASARKANREALVSASLAQLGRLFGSRAEKPVKTVIRDWATEPDTATDADQGFGMEHPSTEITGRIQSIWHGQVLFGASEMAPQFGGYMEGALEQAQRVAQHVLGETANLRSTLLAGSPDSPHQP